MGRGGSGAVHDPTAASHTFRCRHPFAAATKEKQKNISVVLTCSKRREILCPPSTRGKDIGLAREAPNVFAKLQGWQPLWGKLLFILAALIFYEIIAVQTKTWLISLVGQELLTIQAIFSNFVIQTLQSDSTRGSFMCYVFL